ncbi:MAG: HNH nuclease family protein [Candidatus Tectomicrobia bacterium]|uniref:Putative HNH nuclease YajD n=1 Tax=Tectimicrobiota bacterium TaxID=2528274 RepID=A0A932GR33_UNCTE|nr:HNH nuclease family protein [Candidatus Tectomicrobia bacterium]
MAGRRFVPKKRGGRSFASPLKMNEEEMEKFIAELKAKAARKEDYRERSLAIHGWICAKCGREFDASNLHLLTVHHKDGNHLNNPPDGSNWENLCIYCHEDEHTRFQLGDYLQGK